MDALDGFEFISTTRSTLKGSRNLSVHDQVKALVGRIKKDFDLGEHTYSRVKQVHGDFVVRADADSNAEDVRVLGEADAIYCTEPGHGLIVMTADCAAVSVYCTHSRVFGIAHSGWRSTALDVSARLVEAMCSEGARTQDMHVSLAPCISGDMYEVGREVADAICASCGTDEAVTEKAGGKYLLSLPEAIRIQLRRAGICESRIEMPRGCTFKDVSDFFSWRRDASRERMITVAARTE
ncbi:MAG: polyphenol oxidase family protein [Planctomycetota bacterium]|nr:polyphenol oxidase family protein [Planctomycetota bacterium]